MKKITQRLLIFASLILSGHLASAQTDGSNSDTSDLSTLSAGKPKGTRAMENKARYDSLKTAMNLTPAQSAGVDSVNLEFRTGLAQLKAEGGDRRSKFKQAKTLKNNRESGLKGILSADQFNQLKKYEAEMKEERKAARGQ